MADPLPTTFPPAPSVPNYGIQDQITIDSVVYVIQGINPTDTEKTIEWQDQYDATIGSRRVDLESTCTITVIGPATTPKTGQSNRFPLSVGSALTVRTLKWQINSIAETGSYNGLTVWAIAIRRWTNWPAAGSTLPDMPVGTAAALPITVV